LTLRCIGFLFIRPKTGLQLHMHSIARGFGPVGGARSHPQVIRVQGDRRMNCGAEIDDG
jgi:hypothetical protein